MQKNNNNTILLFTMGKIKKNMDIYVRCYSTIEQPIVLPHGQQIPDNYMMIGICSYNDSWFTSTKEGTYEAIVRTAIEDAQSIGATLIYIAHVKGREYLYGSSCYQMTCHFYKKR